VVFPSTRPTLASGLLGRFFSPTLSSRLSPTPEEPDEEEEQAKEEEKQKNAEFQDKRDEHQQDKAPGAMKDTAKDRIIILSSDFVVHTAALLDRSPKATAPAALPRRLLLLALVLHIVPG
jgi:cell division protein FtsN